MKGLKINVKAAQSIKEDPNTKSSLKNELMENRSEYSEICENIYLSSYRNANDNTFIKNNCFTHIINCAYGSRNFMHKFFEGVEYLTLDLKDDPGFEIIFAFFNCVDFIENAIKNRAKILIHCYEGISRAPAILASYIMWKDKLSIESAINIIKQKRKCIDINLGFIYQLSQWELFLKNDNKDKVYKFGKCGDLTILEYKDCENIFLQNESFILFLLQENKFYRIESWNDKELDPTIDQKIKRFIKIIQTYENYPEIIETIIINNEKVHYQFKSNNKSLLIEMDNLKELFKNMFYLHN